MSANKKLLTITVADEPAATLFCFSYAGGGPSSYLPWASLLPDNVNAYAIQLPGRGSRVNEPSKTTMAEVVAEVIDNIHPHLNLPYLFFGHSLGAKVAYATAKEILIKGFQLPAYLIASACQAPHLPLNRKILYVLEDEEFLQELNRYEGTPKEIMDNQELMELLLPMIKADFEVYETYHTAPIKLDCPIRVLGGIEDDKVTMQELRAWSALSEQQTEVYSIDGGHFYIDSAGKETVAHVNQVISLVSANEKLTTIRL